MTIGNWRQTLWAKIYEKIEAQMRIVYCQSILKYAYKIDKELISNGADPLAHPEMMQPLKIAVEREYASGRVSDRSQQRAAHGPPLTSPRSSLHHRCPSSSSSSPSSYSSSPAFNNCMTHNGIPNCDATANN